MMTKLYICAGILVVVVGSLFGTYWYGHSVGKHEAEIEQLRADVDAHVKREGVHNEVSSMDRYAVCIDIGGLPSDCDELRRMEESTEAE